MIHSFLVIIIHWIEDSNVAFVQLQGLLFLMGEWTLFQFQYMNIDIVIQWLLKLCRYGHCDLMK